MENFSAEYIASLVLKYQQGDITDSERVQLDRWADASIHNRKKLEEWANEEEMLKKLSVYNQLDIEKGWQMLQQKRAYEIKSIAKVARIRRVWVAAAAIVVMLLAAGGYLIFNTHAPQQIVKNKKEQPLNGIAPGSNKAILTLADGTKLVLDSANNGAITRQGNVTVIKLGDGLLSYKKASGKEVQVVYNTITTPRGGQYQLVLADGSKVWLNAASSITYPTTFTGNQRKVAMTGEAYFEIAHNAKMPFIVSKGDVEVKVLGTHFNVNAYEDEGEIRITLLEGSVNVLYGAYSKKIAPGEQARIQPNSDEGITVAQVDVHAAVAWKNGYFHFNNANLKEVMRQLSRWYDIEVQYSGGVASRRFGGEISRTSDLKEVLQILEESKVHFKIEGREIIVAP